MPPPSKKKKPSDSTSSEDSTVVNAPSLPDDLLLMIFGELSTEERVSLGTSCKRFRELDFELGRKSFDEICVLVAAKKNVSRSKIELVCRLTKTVKCRKFRIMCDPEIANFEELITILFENRNLLTSQVALGWNKQFSLHNVANISNIRDGLIKLPRMDKFLMNMPLKDIKLRLFDDKTLLHITSHSNHAELKEGNFTAQALVEAFEIACKSEVPNKYILFYVEKTVIDELFSMPSIQYAKVIDSTTKLIDRQRNTMLDVLERLDGRWRVEIGKMNAEGALIIQDVEL